MPVMDGMTMLAKLRQDAWGKDANVIILTNLNENEKINESVRSGVFGYLIKTDWKIEEVVGKIRERLAGKV